MIDDLLETFISMLKTIANGIKYILVDTIFDLFFNKYNSKNGFYYDHKIWFILLIFFGLIYLLLRMY